MRAAGPLAPLRHRQFRLLWTGMSASLIGDGMLLVALAWQVYDLFGVPAAMSAVTTSETAGFICEATKRSQISR